MRTTLTTLLALAALALFAGTADAALYVYEGFNYKAGEAFTNQPNDPGDIDATGFSGDWQHSGVSNLIIDSGSLSFSNLATSGNKVIGTSRSSNEILSRAISADLDAEGEMWFSFLGNMQENQSGGGQEGLVIGNQPVNNSQILADTGSSGLIGFGIAPTSAGNNWTAYAWNGSSQSVGSAAYTVSVNAGVLASNTNLLVGYVSFNTGTGGADEYSIYYVTNDGDISSDDLVQIGSTIEIDVDETTLDTLSLTRHNRTAFDEIRIADNFNEAVGIPEPGSLALLGIAGLALLGIRRRR